MFDISKYYSVFFTDNMSDNPLLIVVARTVPSKCKHFTNKFNIILLNNNCNKNKDIRMRYKKEIF
jgi:hypothetical protein